MDATILGKPIQFAATKALDEKYGGLELAGYIQIARAVLAKHPHDMLVFSMANENLLQVRLAGYHLKTEVLDETSVVYKTASLHIDTFWLKIDDYGDKYIGTFLFPEEY